MEILLYITLVVLGIGLLFCSYMLYRNARVAKYRGDIIENIYKLRPGEASDAWKQRDEYYRSVSYDDMMKKFWKPLNSFYDGRKFK